jgi:hypothetical protein
MKKLLMLIAVLVLSGKAWSGLVGLPTERLVLPAVEGSHLVCIWDETAEAWVKDFESYDQSGQYEFLVPEWGRWYWIGLWDEAAGEYVFGKWIGHFITE